MSVYNTCNKKTVGGPISPIKGYATISSTDPAKLAVSFPSVGNQTAPYWVMHVEVDAQGNYQQAIVWGCEYVAVEFLWILSRTPTISSDLYTKLHDMALHITGMKKLIPTLQTGCHYPTNRW